MAPGVKIRHADRRAVLPHPVLAVEQIAQFAAGETEEAGQRDAREVGRPGGTDQGIRGDQVLFRPGAIGENGRWPSIARSRLSR